MPLSPGARLGSYEIVSAIGSGGMGDVFRARDHRLGRDVAIKTLPDLFAHDPDRLARFEREARTLASLNHPNIAGIYGVEEAPATASSPAVHAIVMELVPGRTLAEIINDLNLGHGTLDQAEAMAIARSIAEALEAAHDAGIVHRDLKPANVKVRDDGAVKVLDFGLAKGQDESSGTAAATMTSPAMTQAGVILGTAAYMSPEQARGKPVDRRADIWAFGVVVYEMLTRHRLFDGETVSDVVAAVLTRQIDLAALPPGTPPRIRELLARCLERDPKKRLRDIGEARIALADPATSDPNASYAAGPSSPSSGPVATPRSSRLPWAIAALAVIAAGTLAILQFTSSRPAPPSQSSLRLSLEIAPPPEGDFIIGSNAGSIIMAPDGSTVAFLVQTSAGPKLFVRSLTTGETHAVPGVVDASYPFWSPDSKKIGYFGSSKLYTITLAGGLPEAIADIQQGRGGAWTDAGVILFTPIGGGTIHRVSERGGEVKTVTTNDASRGENAHYWPVALPGGRKFLFFIRSTTPENNGIYLGTVDGSAKPVRVLTSLSSGLYSAPHGGLPGRLLWVRDTNLLAQTFDPETGALSGDVSTIAEDVRVEESQRGIFAGIANDGTLAFASARASDFQLVMLDRSGRRLEPLPIAPGKTIQPGFSSDDRKLLFTRASGGTADLWTYDFASKAVQQLTTDPDYDEAGSWSPDSSLVLHQGRRDGDFAMLLASVNGAAPQVVSRGRDLGAGSFARDGKAILVPRSVEQDIAMIRLADLKTVIPLTKDPGIEQQPEQSPDGHWLAFTSTQSGHSEVVLTEFQDDGTKVTIGEQRLPVSSGGGGADPHWRKDGKEILYTSPSGQLMSVSVTIAGKSATLGRPTPLPITSTDSGGWGTNSTHTTFVVVEASRAVHQTFRVITGR